MEIGNLFKAKENLPPPEYFLALQIQEGIVKTAVWQVDQAVPKVTSYGSVEKWSDLDTLVVAADTSLSIALEGQNIEPDRVIFGLPDSWVKEDKINPEQAPFLKELISKLELKPIGFVVITEAVIQQLKAQEGIPPTAVFLELHSTKVNVVVAKLGETIGKEEVGRSADLAKDVEEGLARLNLDSLPARMLVIDGDEPDLEQQLTSYSWQEALPFLHLPKVEIPDPQFSIKAVAIAGGSQAARSLGIEIIEEEKPVAATTGEDQLPATDSSDTDDIVEPEVIEKSPDSIDGFVIGQDIRNLDDTPEPTMDNDEVSEPVPGPSAPANKLGSLLDKLKSLSPRSLPLPALPSGNFKKPLLIGIPATVIVLFVLAGFFFSRTSSANITVYVEDHQIDKSFEIAIADTPQDIPTLPATTESLELEATNQVSTSGEALVGEKATGKITVYNRTDSEKTLEKGTILVDSKNHKFTLDSAVTIASQSAGTVENNYSSEPGKTDGTLTASAIGAESNIDKDTELSIGSFPKSSLVAKTNDNFSGGTSRTVKAVSKKDQETLLEQLKAEITSEAEAKLASTAEYQIVSQGVEIIEEDFSNKAGEEADTLSLTLKAKANFLKFHKDRLNDLLKDQLSADIPTGYVLGDKDSQISVDEPTTNEADLITTNTHIKASLIPDINIEDYQKKIKGKSVETAKTLLQNIPGYKKVVFEISPKVPFFSSRLPGNQAKITLKLAINP